jgi:hypothetical protein
MTPRLPFFICPGRQLTGATPVYINRQPLTDKAQTADEIKYLVDTFFTDLDNIFIDRKDGTRMKLSDMSLQSFFDFVRTIPYRRDISKPVAREIVARPHYVVKHRALGMDCKKKAVLIASFLKRHAIPFRFIGSSERKDKRIHHIFCQGWFNGIWKNVDATYRDYKLFEPKKITAFEIL